MVTVLVPCNTPHPTLVAEITFVPLVDQVTAIDEVLELPEPSPTLQLQPSAIAEQFEAEAVKVSACPVDPLDGPETLIAGVGGGLSDAIVTFRTPSALPQALFEARTDLVPAVDQLTAIDALVELPLPPLVVQVHP